MNKIISIFINIAFAVFCMVLVDICLGEPIWGFNLSKIFWLGITVMLFNKIFKLGSFKKSHGDIE